MSLGRVRGGPIGFIAVGISSRLLVARAAARKWGTGPGGVWPRHALLEASVQVRSGTVALRRFSAPSPPSSIPSRACLGDPASQVLAPYVPVVQVEPGLGSAARGNAPDLEPSTAGAAGPAPAECGRPLRPPHRPTSPDQPSVVGMKPHGPQPLVQPACPSPLQSPRRRPR